MRDVPMRMTETGYLARRGFVLVLAPPTGFIIIISLLQRVRMGIRPAIIHNTRADLFTGF